MINNRLHTPEGVKDYLPFECAYKKEVEKKIEHIFNSYGFNPIKSPMFEYMEVFEGKGSIDRKEMYKFLDRDGSILALRSDITPAIARIAATNYEKKDIPLRFSYTENAFRYNEHYQGKLREFTQAGIELIGVNSVDADAEILAIAINSILASGITDFRLDIGHVQFLQGVLEEAELSNDICESIQMNIIKKNYVAVEDIVDGVEVSERVKSIFTQLPLLIGGVELLDKLSDMVSNEVSLNAIEHLRTLYKTLENYGLEKYIYFDLSVIGHFDYYTGIIFRGYTQGTGFSIIDGGRYDNLISQYGADYPSVGFGIKVNDLITALHAQNVELKINSVDMLISYTKDGKAVALLTADKLRKTNVIVENSLLGDALQKNNLYALEKGIKTHLYFMDNHLVKKIDVATNTEEIIEIDSIIGKGVE